MSLTEKLLNTVKEMPDERILKVIEYAESLNGKESLMHKVVSENLIAFKELAK